MRIFGAAEHNLRDVDVTFGPGLTAVVGVSGSGKSSLAFDVVYTEARRRFFESLGMGRPGTRVPAAQVRSIEGLGPAVAIAQNVLNVNPASTVATSVGLHPFLRILFARFADVSADDRRVRDLVTWLETLRGPYGLWEHQAHPQLSRWLTFDLECSLRRLADGDWIGTEEPAGFTTDQRGRRRY